MSTPVRIHTPKSDQYIELIPAEGFTSNLSGTDCLAERFDEVLIVRGARQIRLLALMQIRLYSLARWRIWMRAWICCVFHAIADSVPG